MLIGRLERYLARQVTWMTLVALFAFAVLIALSSWLDERSSEISSWQALQITLGQLPRRMIETFPFVGLVGALVALSNLASQQELTAMRAAGMRLSRIVGAVCTPAVMLSLLGWALSESSAPAAERWSTEVKALARKDEQQTPLSWIKDGESFVAIRQLVASDRVLGMQIWEFDQRQLQRVRLARTAHVEGTIWRLQNVQELRLAAVGDSQWTSSTASEWQSTSPSAQLLANVHQAPQLLRLSQLWQRTMSPEATEAEHLALWQRLSQPLSAISLVLVGLGLVLGPLRSLSLGARLAAGILCGLTFKYLQDLTAPVALVFGGSTVLAVLLPIVLCFAAGTWVVWRAR